MFRNNFNEYYVEKKNETAPFVFHICAYICLEITSANITVNLDLYV